MSNKKTLEQKIEHLTAEIEKYKNCPYTNIDYKQLYIKTNNKVEKLAECVRFYASKTAWSVTNTYPTHEVRQTMQEGSVETEWFENEKCHISGGIARKTLKELKIEQ